MKKSVLSVAVVLATLCACQKEAAQQEETPSAAPRQYTVSIDATKGIDTKVLALDGDAISSTWGEQDAVAVCVKGDVVVGKLVPETTGEAATKLTGTITLDGMAEGTELYLQYPYEVVPDGDKLWPHADYTYQDGTLENVPNYATCGVVVESIDGDHVSTSKASFYNRQAIVKFTIKNADGRPVEATKLFVYAEDVATGFWYDEYYSNSGIYVTPSAATNEFFVALHNDGQDRKQYTLVAFTSNGVYTKVSPGSVFPDGKYHTASVKMNKLNYNGYDYTSSWGLIGHLTDYDVEWNNELNMWTDNEGNHVAATVTLKEGDEFKFRQNQDWAVNRGGAMGASPDAFIVSQDGANCVVKEDGIYDVYFNEYSNVAIFVPASNNGKTSELVNEPYIPDPQPEVTGWNIIGSFNGWASDILATETARGVWTVIYEVLDEGGCEFKWRQNGSWDNNYGAASSEEPFIATVDEPFEAAAGGSNIKVTGPGYYRFVLDLNFPTPMLVVSNYTVWSLIGKFNDWGGDVDMTLVDGKWISPATFITSANDIDGGFKIRKNHSWNYADRGLSWDNTVDQIELGVPYLVESGGNNIKPPADGTYIVTYDPSAQTITVVAAE